MSSNNERFTHLLLQWYDPARRFLPWKNESDPYLIWLSEIILQQTRVDQGLPYYEQFRDNYPTVKHLADAPEDEVMKLWQGLGYYSRARNLHAAAKYMSNELGGQFPDTYEGILKLKGVGPYTAAAIASFAYGLPHAVVDGNVFRVLARYYGIDTPIDSTKGKKQFTKLAQSLLPADQPGLFNQAIMDFGALVCKPALPDCANCPLKHNCVAFKNDQVQQLPVKEGKIKVRTRHFNYLVILYKNTVYLNKRTDKDIWKNLYDFPMIEADKLLSARQLIKEEGFAQYFPNDVVNIEEAGRYAQKLTHQKIHAVFFEVEVDLPPNTKENWIAVEREKMSNFAFPKIVDCYLADKALYLNLS